MADSEGSLLQDPQLPTEPLEGENEADPTSYRLREICAGEERLTYPETNGVRPVSPIAASAEAPARGISCQQRFPPAIYQFADPIDLRRRIGQREEKGADESPIQYSQSCSDLPQAQQAKKEKKTTGTQPRRTREFDERSAILACPNDCSGRLLEASKKEKILRDLLDRVRSEREREVTDSYELGVCESWNRAKEFLNKEHAREIQPLEADVQSQKMHTKRLEAIHESEWQEFEAACQAEIRRLMALLQTQEVEKLSRGVQVGFEDDIVATEMLTHSLQQTESGFAPLMHSYQQTEAHFAPLMDSSQPTQEDFEQLQLQWEQELDQERITSTENLRQLTEDKCRLEARIGKLCDEMEDSSGVITGLRAKVRSQQDQLELLNSQHERDLDDVQSLTQQLEDEVLNRLRPVPASDKEPIEEDFAQLRLRWENDLDYERQISAERLQQAIDEKREAEDELSDILVELGGLREKVHSCEQEMELHRLQNEKEVGKIHAKYAPQRRQDEERERTRRDKEEQNREKHYREAYGKWDWDQKCGADRRTYEEFVRDYRPLTERHDFNQQFPEYAESLGVDKCTSEVETEEQCTSMDAEEVRLFDGRNPEIETKERSTETHPDEVVLSDNRMVGLDTNDQSTEIDAEEVELRSGCVSPIPSSLLAEPQGGVELKEMVKKDTEERIAREKEFAEQRIAECIASEKASAEKRVAREMKIAEERLLCEKRLAEERIAYERKIAEEEVQKVHAKYDCQRMQDEEQRRTRVTQQREREERHRNEKRKELYVQLISEWQKDNDDLRSRTEVDRAHDKLMRHYDGVHQYLGGDGCTVVTETKDQSTETDVEEAELRSGNVSPASSSVISLLASRRQCSVYSSDSSEGSHTEFSEDEVGPPVLPLVRNPRKKVQLVLLEGHPSQEISSKKY